ncbi:MAG: redoxin domain-containing protein [Candidatus Aenigmarchaeota archaeon]|nr:redoxin domain-containing protein [Candidatus Aenigmarchaeota archaeon]
MKNLQVALLLLAILAGAVFLASLKDRMILPQTPGNHPASLRIGEIAPNFVVTTINGDALRLAEIKKPVLLIFSATWCPACRATLDATKKVYPKYENNVSLISIGIDLSETAKDIEKYKTSSGYPGIFAIGNGDIITDYKVSSTSTKYVIKDGVIVYSDIGAMGEDEMENVLKGLV